jgi:GH25 family lysozyme M1 (1,4-beta-N-acetylmuramidase)
MYGFCAKGVKMGRKDDADEGRKRPKQKRAGAVVSIANTLTPYRYTLKSPAVYDFYEGEYPVDWEAIKATAPLRVVFQATYGRHGRHGDDRPDRFVRQYVDEAKANNVKYGLYHFLKPNSIAEQADFYLNTVQSLGGFGDMEPIVDVEHEPSRKDKNAVNWAQWAG